ISSIGPPSRCTRPEPAVTISICPSGWECHAVRAPGSKVTLPPETRDGAFAGNSGSTRTVPVNQSGDPLLDGCEPLRWTSISILEAFSSVALVCAPSIAGMASAATAAAFSNLHGRVLMMSSRLHHHLDRLPLVHRTV